MKGNIFASKSLKNKILLKCQNVILMNKLIFLIKEPKEEEMTEEEKAAQKARPIATNPIPGTPWYAHHITFHSITPLRFLFLFFHCVCMGVNVYPFLLGAWFGRVMIACSSTTRQRGCRCGTGPRSWLVELMLTNTSRSLRTREDWRTARRQVWTNTFSHVVSVNDFEKVNLIAVNITILQILHATVCENV